MKKTLRIDFQKKADKFIKKNNVSYDEISALIKKAVRKINGKEENVELKLLRGNLLGYFRIRKGDVRIIFKYSKSDNIIIATIVNIDFRGNVYK